MRSQAKAPPSREAVASHADVAPPRVRGRSTPAERERERWLQRACRMPGEIGGEAGGLGGLNLGPQSSQSVPNSHQFLTSAPGPPSSQRPLKGPFIVWPYLSLPHSRHVFVHEMGCAAQRAAVASHAMSSILVGSTILGESARARHLGLSLTNVTRNTHAGSFCFSKRS